MLPRRTIALLVIALLGWISPARAQSNQDIIRGRVIGPDKKPVENVTVTATSLVNQTSRTAKTNKDGRFTIIFADGGGDYMMAYVGIGFAPTRFEVKREVDEDVLIADATVSKSAVQLDAVRVQAGRERPDRNGNQQEIGGREQTLNTNNVPIDILGDLSAMAATLPGITLIPNGDGTNGISVLGLSVDQNNITLNGLNFNGTDLPRDATTQTRVTTSTFDPSRGGFSGAQIALRTNSGTNYVTRSLHQTVDAPSLQYTDATGRALGQQFTNLQLSGNAAGPIALDKAFYSFSWQLGRRTSNLSDLLNADPLAFERVNVSADSVQRLIQLLNQQGIPLTSTSIPHGKLTQNGSFISSFDFSPSGTHNFDITMNGRWSGQDATNLSTTAVPLHGGETRSYGGTLQARHSAYFHDSFLDETSGSLQQSISTGDPYANLPSATVRVNSTFADGTAPGVSSLQFGGNSGLPRDSRTTTGELQNQISWISLDNKHRYKFGLDFRYNRYAQDNTGNRLGTFVYNSIQDFENGIPASYSRRLQVNRRLGDDFGASAWLGDSYRRTPRFQLTYGLRVDASDFQGNPQFNAQLDSIFGHRNDAVPRGIYVSPRLGFSWTYGTNPQIGGFEGAARGSRGQISGGFGEFQNLPNSQLIAAAVDQTGLPSAAQQLTCVGTAVPVANWLEYMQSTSSIPTTCAGDVTTYSSTVPNVTLFAPDYIPQRSWRAVLNWNAPILNNRFRMTSGATYSLNLNQQSQIDLNFNQQAKFTLPSEGRPVYANLTSIVPTTGSTLSRDARASQDYAQVIDYVSDLKSHSTQLTFGLSPIAFNSAFQWSATYVWQRITDQSRGFNGTTSGDPYLTQWARGDRDARHQITYNLGYTFHQAVSVTAFGRFQSGNPFTPMVSGDVNGDGYNNDRAYIYNPSSANIDPTLAANMQKLLTNAPSSVRDCLQKQLGTIAGKNSCEGPWSTALSLRVSLISQAMKVIPDRATISLGIANPLTGVDALVHGSNNLHGWGAPSIADPTLLYVRGFDPVKQQFIYDVNQRFGSSRQASALNLAPMQLTLDVRLDVGPERERQDLFLRLRSGRGGKGNKLSEQAIKLQYMRQYPNPFEQMLRQGDSLGLSNEVADSIAILNKTYGKAIDSIWTPVAKYLAALPDKYNLDEAYEKVSAAENQSLDKMAVYGPAAKHLLTSEQIRKLPPFIALFLDNQAIRNVRPGRAGGGRGGFFGT